MKSYFIGLLICVSLFSFKSVRAQQNDKNVDNDGVVDKQQYHYIGVQGNLLLKQFLSLNSNAFINTNPFTATYAMANRKSGNGFGIGVGFDLSATTNNDGVQSVTIDNKKLAARVGFERHFLQHQKFSPFLGIGASLGVLYNKTSTVLNQSIQNAAIEVISTQLFIGPTGQAGLNYCVTEHFLIGTEMNFNFRIGVTNTSVRSGTTNTQSNTTGIGDIGINAPTAIFLIFRF